LIGHFQQNEAIPQTRCAFKI